MLVEKEGGQALEDRGGNPKPDRFKKGDCGRADTGNEERNIVCRYS